MPSVIASCSQSRSATNCPKKNEIARPHSAAIKSPHRTGRSEPSPNLSLGTGSVVGGTIARFAGRIHRAGSMQRIDRLGNQFRWNVAAERYLSDPLGENEAELAADRFFIGGHGIEDLGG